MRAREPASFWREKVKVVVIYILLRVLARSSCGNKLSNVRSFMIFRSEEGLTSVNTDNSVQNKCNEAFQGVYLLRLREKTLSHISSW